MPETSSECSWSWHLFLIGIEDSGGFPAETVGAAAMNMDDPNFPFETLPSPVIADDMKDELEETLNSSSVVVLGFELNKLGLAKSRVTLCACGCAKLGIEPGAEGAGATIFKGTGEEAATGGAGENTLLSL